MLATAAVTGKNEAVNAAADEVSHQLRRERHVDASAGHDDGVYAAVQRQSKEQIRRRMPNVGMAFELFAGCTCLTKVFCSKDV